MIIYTTSPQLNEHIELIKTDKNGTKHYVDHRCPKCGGTGNISYYGHVEGGICFKCNGSGRYDHKFSVRTPEYQAKLDARRLERNKRAAIETNKAWLSINGFDNGITYIYLGNTFEIKDQLKAAGAKFHNQIGWHSAHQIGSFASQQFMADSIVQKDIAGTITGFSDEGLELISICKKEYNISQNPVSNYVGEVGKRQEFELIQETTFCVDGFYGLAYINKFKDADGNIFIWKTGKQVARDGEHVKIKGTIKEHSEYRDVKQTVLTRCKIIWMEVA